MEKESIVSVTCLEDDRIKSSDFSISMGFPQNKRKQHVDLLLSLFFFRFLECWCQILNITYKTLSRALWAVCVPIVNAWRKSSEPLVFVIICLISSHISGRIDFLAIVEYKHITDI